MSAETPLAATTFVVVDLETTGSKPPQAGITEIGAVKVRGGMIQGTFASLVNPGHPIPEYIRALTGISTQMVCSAPDIAVVLPTFLEFLGGGVLVAHHAPFDVGFLTSACAVNGVPWPDPVVIDTVVLARRVLHSGEVPNRKLATLARHFRVTRQPNHRATQDALATVDVLHALLDRLGRFKVTTLEGLVALTSA